MTARECEGDFGEPIYIGQAIAYTNGDPHVGHAYEIINIDLIARYHKTFGRDCLFSSGTDEHGQKIAETAKSHEKTPIEICDYYSGKFSNLQTNLSCTPDIYVRTTSEAHKANARKCWQKCVENGDIYLDQYEGWYDVRNETFIPGAQAATSDYKDPETGTPYRKTTEECYFFRLSKYGDRLLDWIRSNPKACRPEAHRNSIISFIESGLDDICVSRTTFDWGIPVPDVEGHVMYVWFDALTNYITNLDYLNESELYQKHWNNPETTKKNVIIVGKDIIRFHCIIWPAILMSAGISPPNSIHAHGFVGAADGRKMSKSVGNVISPVALLDSFKSDSLRFYCSSGAIYGQDMKFDEVSLVDTHNGTLADVLGNLINRATALTKKTCGGAVPEISIADEISANDLPFCIRTLRNECDAAMDDLAIHEYCNLITGAARNTNKYLADKAPWLRKNDVDFQQKTIKITLQACYILVLYFLPLCPDAMTLCLEKSFGNFRTPLAKLSDAYDTLPVGHPIEPCGVLFPKIEAPKNATEKSGESAYQEAKKLKEEKKALMRQKQREQRDAKNTDA